MKLIRVVIACVVICITGIIFASKAWAFCGFYVAKADAKLYNQASQVAIARDGNRTVLTMANDYQGEVKDFAIVVPVPVVLKKEQVKIAAPKIIERLDAFSAPRLVEYFDGDPCQTFQFEEGANRRSSPAPVAAPAPRARGGDLGVTVEAKFNVGEYDILILSAKESNGLQTWLNQNGYKIPRGASELLKPYIRQKLKFFVAKVNIEKFDQSGIEKLRSLQISYESPRFMLPIRLGMINAKQAQDLLVYVLSAQGQAEVTNYRTVKVPSGDEVPVFVKNEFSDFYKSMFQTSYDREGRNVAFLEYAWDMSNCDPCSAEPLSPEELKQAGVFWLDAPTESPRAVFSRRRPPMPNSGVYITRLHVRYTRDKFPEDLNFQATSNRELFQGRYVLRHPFTGEATCQQARRYQRSLPQRFEKEAQTLARLTNWKIDEIRKKIPAVPKVSWVQQFWLSLVD
jgi:hypothetical protein